MELSINILFYFEHRWKTKIIAHKTESSIFTKIFGKVILFLIWIPRFNVVLPRRSSVESCGLGSWTLALVILFKHSFHRDTIYF